jgi:hypothetical protein
MVSRGRSRQGSTQIRCRSRRSEPLITVQFEFNVLRSRSGGLLTFGKETIDIMFKYRLSRLPFFILMVIYNILAIGMLDAGSLVSISIIILSMPIALILIVLPRVRDCDWPQWVGFITIIPYLGDLTGIALLFASSKVIRRSDDPDRIVSESQDHTQYS